MRAKTISIVNQKGGVGKTTTTLNLAVALHLQGQRVLMVDADQQANLTSSMTATLETPPPMGLSELIHYAVADMPLTPDLFIGRNKGLDIITSSKLLAAANSLLGAANDSGSILAKALKVLTQDGEDYDFVLIDCPRSLDLLVTNCLNASDSVIIPTEPADYSIEGIVEVWETVTRLQTTTNPQLHVGKIIINKFSTSKKNHHARAETIAATFGGMVFRSSIPLLKEIEESPADIYAMSRDKRSKAWPLWMALASEVINDDV